MENLLRNISEIFWSEKVIIWKVTRAIENESSFETVLAAAELHLEGHWTRKPRNQSCRLSRPCLAHSDGVLHLVGPFSSRKVSKLLTYHDRSLTSIVCSYRHCFLSIGKYLGIKSMKCAPPQLNKQLEVAYNKQRRLSGPSVIRFFFCVWFNTQQVFLNDFSC